MDPAPLLHLQNVAEPTAFSCPGCGHPLPRRVRREAWVEVPVGDGWIAAYRLVVVKGSPVVAEARVLPQEEGPRRAGRWSGRPEAVPAGGLPGQVLRRLRLSDPLELFPRFLENWRARHGRRVANTVLGRVELSVRSRLVSPRPGRAGRPEDYYATWAKAYADLMADGVRDPIKRLSIDPPVRVEGYVSSDGGASEATIRSILGEARKRGLLSAAPPGRAGGELTAKARRILRASS